MSSLRDTYKQIVKDIRKIDQYSRVIYAELHDLERGYDMMKLKKIEQKFECEAVDALIQAVEAEYGTPLDKVMNRDEWQKPLDKLGIKRES